METQNKRIELYKARNLSGRLMSTFQFINDNFRVLLRLSSYILLPLSMILALFLSFYGDAGVRFAYSDELTTEMAIYVSLVFILAVITIAGSCAFYGLLYLLLDKYRNKESISSLKFTDIRPQLIKIALHFFGLYMVLFVISLLAGGICGVLINASAYTVFITVPLLFLVALPLLLTPSVYYFERKGIVASLSRSYRIGMPAWGSTFLIWFAIMAISFVILLVAGAPWLVANSIKMLYTDTLLSGEAASLPFYFYLIYFLVAFCVAYVGLVMQGVMGIGMIFQYGSIIGKREEQAAFDQELIG